MISIANKRSGFTIAFLLLLISIAAVSCRSTKKIQTAISKKDTSSAVIITNQSANDSITMVKNTLSELNKKRIDFTTFAGKIKAEYEDSKGKQLSVTAYVHIIKDSLIWVSIYGSVFNIEAFRVLITKDSVTVLNKLDKEVQYRSFDYLQDITQIPFDFKTLQDLIIGNPIYFDSNVISYKRTEARTLLATKGDFFKHLLTINNADTSILQSKLDDIDISRNRTAFITYDQYENGNSIRFSTYREISVSEKTKLDIHLKFKQFEFNKDLSISFTVPKNYKRN